MRGPLLRAVLTVGVMGLAAGAREPDRAGPRALSADAVRAHVRFLASDLLEGRGPATRGDALAEAYIAAEFEGMGLKPAGADGGYVQPFQLTGISSQPQTLTVHGGGRTVVLEHHRDFMAAAGQPVPETKVEGAELVFVGYGIVAPEYQWDDFKGVDLKGKVLLVMNNDPENDPRLFAGATRLFYGRWDYKYEEAARKGALGAVILHTPHSAGYPWQVVQTSWSGERFELPADGAPKLALKAWVTDEAARKVVTLAGRDLDELRAKAELRDFRPVPLGIQVSTSFTNVLRQTQTGNVLALLPGSDPAKRGQVVVYTAHHDHLGVRPGAHPGADAIYNGALDNASGVAELLALARAFSELPRAPSRSILFASVGAEEQGLLGSKYLAQHLPVAADQVAVDINMDGASIFGRTSDVTVLGLGKTDVDATLARLALSQGRVLRADPEPDRGSFYRSDQFSFARAGIPAVHFVSGHEVRGKPQGWGKAQSEVYVQKHYHQPSDELTASWDLGGAVEDLQLYFRLGLEIANQAQLPRWTPGDEFEAVRKAAGAKVRAP